MTYLLGPYTTTILQLFQLSAAWILYLGIVVAVIGSIMLVSRTAIYKRSKEIDIHIRPAAIEAIGLFLLVIGLVLAAPGADALSQTIIVGGGPSLQQCVDLPPAACLTNGNTGACLPSNIGTASCKTDPTSLGVWKNFPSGAAFLDKNELFFNNTHRVIVNFPTGESGVTVELSVICFKPSNTLGANLQLQYATFSETTDANTTNFTNVAAGLNVLIDNSAGWPCAPATLSPGPGPLTTGMIAFPATGNANQVTYIFRVVGAGGGGTGDNPRISSVTIQFAQSVNNIITTGMDIGGTAQGTAFFFTAYPSQQGINFNFAWQASNSTLEQRGSGTCAAPTPPVSTCNVAFVYPTAWSVCCVPTSGYVQFKGINGSPGTLPPAVTLALGSFILFSVPMVTV